MSSERSLPRSTTALLARRDLPVSVPPLQIKVSEGLDRITAQHCMSVKTVNVRPSI
jgi:hypothetical protein